MYYYMRCSLLENIFIKAYENQNIILPPRRRTKNKKNIFFAIFRVNFFLSKNLVHACIFQAIWLSIKYLFGISYGAVSIKIFFFKVRFSSI